MRTRQPALVAHGLSFPGDEVEATDVTAPEPEASFMFRVIQYARLMGWEVHHELDSRGSSPGWPDLELVRGPRHIRAELKREGQRLRPEQEYILALLRRVPCLETYVWRPSDWQTVLRVLGRQF